MSSLRSEASQGATRLLRCASALRVTTSSLRLLLCCGSEIKHFASENNNPDCAGERPTTEVDKGFHGRSQVTGWIFV